MRARTSKVTPVPSTRLTRGFVVGLVSAAFCLAVVLEAGALGISHRPVLSGEYRAAGKFHMRVRMLVRANRIHFLQLEQVERCSDGTRTPGGFSVRYTVPGAGLPIHPGGVFIYRSTNGSHGNETLQGRFIGDRVIGYFKASHPKHEAAVIGPTCGTVKPNGLPIHFSGHLTHRP
jgi:hypothetical protein